jgi:hypothetical protein
MSSTSWRILLFCVAVAGLAIASCGHPSNGGSSGTGGSADCTPGEHLCACMPGNTCNSGLQCADDVNKCVMIGTSSGTGGSGNSPGTGGSNPGTGGVMNTGGSSATGGTSGGTGGSSSTGGSGGSSSTGGSNGTGGMSGTNLVTNGDLSNGDTGWGVGSGSPTTKGVMNGQYCVTFSNMTILVGWGNSSVAANLSSGASYTLSYQASSTDSNTTVEIHVGQAVSPYNSDASNITGDKPGSSLTTFSHTFMSTANDSTAGLAFLFASSGSNVTACIDNVVLTKN